MTPRVSILVPAFNREHLLAECLLSALHQSLGDFELVVVDNASTDGTWEVCKRVAATDPRVRIFRNNTNIGPVRNWARCAMEARAPIAKLLFSDDLLEPECLSSMVPHLDNPDVGLVYCAARVGQARATASVFYASGEDETISQNEFLRRILCGTAPVSPGAVLLRTEDLRRNLHDDFPTPTRRDFAMHGAGPDVMISLMTAEAYPNVVALAQPLVYFRAHEKSITVENANNQVTAGYVSAISYYLISRGLYRQLHHYLARSWLQALRRKKRWVSLFGFLREYSGDASPRRTLTLAVTAVYHVTARLWCRRCVNP